MRADERQPVAMIKNCADTSEPSPLPPLRVRIVQRPVASSNVADYHAGVELDVAAQIEAIGNVVRVIEDLGLGRVALRPLPLLLELVGELVRVLHALDVAARAGIAIPVPGPADAVAGFEHPHRQADAPGAVQHVHAREPGPHDHYVVITHARIVTIVHPSRPEALGSGEPARVTRIDLLALGEGLDDRGAEGRHRDAPASTLDHRLANERLAADVELHDGLVVVEEHDSVHFDGRRVTGQLIERGMTFWYTAPVRRPQA